MLKLVSFPIPGASTSESKDASRDQQKRAASPPSWFFSQTQATYNAVQYIEPLDSGYPGSAVKHKNRMRSALFAQTMASFEFVMKDFIAQVLDCTHIYDDDAKKWEWLTLDLPTVLATREGFGRLGASLIHPLGGWQVPAILNQRYKDVFQREPIASDELGPLGDLWIVRHSVAHNGGVVTQPDARRLRTPILANEQVLIDVPYLNETINFLRRIVERLETVVAPSLLQRWLSDGASGDWEHDKAQYISLKLLTTYVKPRTRDLPEITEAIYEEDTELFAQAPTVDG